MRRLRSGLRARFTPTRVTLAVVLIAGVLALAAALEGSEPGAPAHSAARLVPADAVVYVHGSVGRDSEQWERVTALVEKLPELRRAQNRLLRTLTRRGGALDLEREVRPWVDDEAALALVPDRKAGLARSLILLEVSDRELANAFLSRAVGDRRRTEYRGVELRSFGRLATAFVRDFLVIGQPDNVRSAIDVAARRSQSLAADPVYRRALRGLPDVDRALLAYASRRGLRGVVEREPGLTGRLATLADDPGLEGIAGVLRVDDDGMRAHLSSALQNSPRAEQFNPRLLEAVSGDAIAYLGMRGATDLLESVSSAVGAVPDEVGLGRLLSDLENAGGLRTLGEIAPLLDGEAALFVSRSAAVPVITLVVDDVDDRDAERLLARLGPLLARVVQGGAAGGQVPTFNPVQIAGVDAASLRIGPGVELTYAIFDGRLVVATSPGGIRRVKRARSRITDNELFAPGMRNDLRRVASVLFLDLEQLLALGEQAGLGDAPGYQGLKSDLSPVRAVSALTHVNAQSKTTEVFIEIP